MGKRRWLEKMDWLCAALEAEKKGFDGHADETMVLVRTDLRPTRTEYLDSSQSSNGTKK
jgi:hypothetical protein